MVAGRTVLIIKNLLKDNVPENHRPIACLYIWYGNFLLESYSVYAVQAVRYQLVDTLPAKEHTKSYKSIKSYLLVSG